MVRGRGLSQKLGQMLALRDETFRATESAGLAVPFSKVRPTLEEAWDAPLDEVLRTVDEDGLAGSVAQVHRAVTRDGEQVAIKVLHPDIARVLQADLANAGAFLSPLGLVRGMDAGAWGRELAESVLSELDLVAEAQAIRRYREVLSGVSGVASPRVLTALSGPTVLVMSWMPGVSVHEARDASWKTRRGWARAHARHFAAALNHGLLHADLHGGNVRYGAELALIDFGAVWEIPERTRLGMLRAVRAVRQRTDESALDLLVLLGFDRTLLEPMAHRLPAVLSVLCEPFGERPFLPSRWRASARLKDILGSHRFAFRIAGSPALMRFLRALQGFVAQLNGLAVPVQVGRALDPVIERHAAALDRLEVPKGYGVGELATKLRISVRSGDERIADVRTPAAKVEEIRELMPEGLLGKLEARGIDLDAQVRSAREQGYRPMVLFELEDGDRTYRISLE